MVHIIRPAPYKGTQFFKQNKNCKLYWPDKCHNMLMINEPKKPEKKSEIEDDSSSTIQFI